MKKIKYIFLLIVLAFSVEATAFTASPKSALKFVKGYYKKINGCSNITCYRSIQKMYYINTNNFESDKRTAKHIIDRTNKVTIKMEQLPSDNNQGLFYAEIYIKGADVDKEVSLNIMRIGQFWRFFQ